MPKVKVDHRAEAMFWIFAFAIKILVVFYVSIFSRLNLQQIEGFQCDESRVTCLISAKLYKASSIQSNEYSKQAYLYSTYLKEIP